MGKKRRARSSCILKSSEHGKIFAGGSFWKRFDNVDHGVATGQFATFVLARYNYLFELATDEDRKLIAAGRPKARRSPQAK